MKKILIFACSLLAVVACDSMWGGTDDPTPVVPGPNVNITLSDETDDSFTVTIEPAGDATYYSYLVTTEDISDVIDPDVLYIGGYKDMAQGMVYWPEEASVTLTFEELHDSRTFYIYAVAGSVEGTVGEIASASFSTPLTYEYVGTGTYYYAGIILDGADTGLELWRNIDDPTKYRIENWSDGEAELNFTVDSDNVVTIIDSYTGVDSATYGPVYIRDITYEWDLSPYGSNGYYDDGTYYFGFEYYCEAGYFGFGYETFILDGTKGPALEDILGDLTVFEYSAYYGSLYYGAYVLEASDDPDYDIMFTTFDEFACSQGNIYGTYDEETGIAEFECDQMFGTYTYGRTTYYLAASLYYYYEYFPITFTFFKNGCFWGPFYGDYVSEDMYTYSMFGGYSYYDFYDVYMYMYGYPDAISPMSAGSAPASHTAALGERGDREPHVRGSLATDMLKLSREEKDALRK